jgi:hypothetical protein
MISRKSARLIADAYATHFKTASSRNGVYTLEREKINTFLYEQEYEYAFLRIMREVIQSDSHQRLAKAIMELHTGEAIASATRGSSDQQRQELGQTFLVKLAEDILNLYETIPVRTVDFTKATSQEELVVLKALATWGRPAAATLKTLISRLEIDGYLYVDGHLYPTESAVIDVREARTILEMLTDSTPLHDKAVIKHHIQESERAYSESRWGHSISDARNFLEAILQQVSAAHHLKAKGRSIPDDVYNRPGMVRKYLEDEGLIDKSEQEAIWKVYGLISNTGSHPNIAEKDQARLMRHLALTFSQFILLKYQGLLADSP